MLRPPRTKLTVLIGNHHFPNPIISSEAADTEKNTTTLLEKAPPQMVSPRRGPRGG